MFAGEELGLSGGTEGNVAGPLLLNGAPVAMCPSFCGFVGVLAADGSLEWVTAFGTGDFGTDVVRFDQGGLVLIGSSRGFSAPFPPTNVQPDDLDPFWARFDSKGVLTAFVPMGSTGGKAFVLGATRAADGGTMVGGTFPNGAEGFPPGSFVGCGASVPLDHPLGFLAHLGPDGVCDRFEPVGSFPVMLSSFGGESTSSGDRRLRRRAAAPSSSRSCRTWSSDPSRRRPWAASPIGSWGRRGEGAPSPFARPPPPSSSSACGMERRGEPGRLRHALRRRRSGVPMSAGSTVTSGPRNGARGGAVCASDRSELALRSRPGDRRPRLCTRRRSCRCRRRTSR